MTHKDRKKLPLFVLAAGAILLGAAALQSVLIVGPGLESSSPHAISVDASRSAATPAPAPLPKAKPSPAAELSDQFPTGTVPDAPHSADHAIDLAHPASPPEPESTHDAPAAAAAQKVEPQTPAAAPPTEKAAEPKVEKPPAQSKPSPQPEPSRIAKSAPEETLTATKVETPQPSPEPADIAKASEEKPESMPAPAPESKPEITAEPKVETPPSEVKAAPQPEPAQIAKKPVEGKPEPVPAVAPKSEVNEAAAELKPLKPEPAPKEKIVATEAKAERVPAPVKKPKEIATAGAQAKPIAKPMSLGFGRIAKPATTASKVTSGHYAANVRATIGRHRPAVRGGGSATVAFSIGRAGGLQGVRVVRSSGNAELDQAAIATVRSAAPFPPPPAGVNPTFSIQIFFR